MTRPPGGRLRRHLLRSGAVTAVLAAGALLFAPTALAATTSQATAQALNATLLGGTLLQTKPAFAANDGTQATATAQFNSPLYLLPGQTALNTGAVSQTAVATATGTSAACAGVVGSGGVLTVGDDGACTVTGAQGPALVSLGNLLGIGNVFLRTNALYAQCTAGPSGTGPYTASSTLVNPSIVVRVGGVTLADVAIPLNGPVNLDVLGATVVANVNQTSTAGPQSSATALTLSLLNGGLLNVNIGQVTCGENVVTADIPMVPLKGMGVAGATVLLVGAGYLGLRRRQGATV
ncbi:hypothetical protein GCM10027047_25330 [Rhodococcus aerolatus]